MKLFKKEELTEANKERGVGLLSSIRIVVNVLYATEPDNLGLVLGVGLQPERQVEHFHGVVVASAPHDLEIGIRRESRRCPLPDASGHIDRAERRYVAQAATDLGGPAFERILAELQREEEPTQAPSGGEFQRVPITGGF